MKFCSSAPSSLSSVLYNLPRPVARPLLANCVRARVSQSKNLSGLHSSSQTRQTEPDGRSDSQVAWPTTEDLFSREPACRPTPLIRNDLPSKRPGKKVAADEIARQRKLKSPFRFPRSLSLLCRVQTRCRRCEEMQRSPFVSSSLTPTYESRGAKAKARAAATASAKGKSGGEREMKCG